MRLSGPLFRCVTVFIVSLFGPPLASAADFSKAPPPFAYNGAKAVPVDFETLHIDYTFDVSARTASARAEVVFKVGPTGGFPILDLVPNPTAVTLDGQQLSLADFPMIDDPDQTTRFRVLRKSLAAGSSHTLQIDYRLATADVTFSGGAVRVGFFMSDLTVGGRAFFEKYGPANYEFDSVKTTFNVHVTNTSTVHEVFTNGDIVGSASNSWRIEFPDYLNTSAYYFHLSDRGRFNVARYTFAGSGGDIPVTVYSATASLTSSAVTSSKRIMAELDETYGAFGHDRLVIYVTSSGGGMEYAGATMTSMSALGHELIHSYFARGVMPANGNAGWIDEAIASWRDNGYPRGTTPNRAAVNLGGFSPYRRHTTRDAYTLGSRLISEFDGMFASEGGMRPILKTLFAEAKHTAITVSDFQAFLERVTGRNLTAIFNRYVYGKAQFTQASETAFDPAQAVGLSSQHPRPYTEAELAIFR